ncbi:MAG: hypothetical protein M1823_005735 [Watsoniomyces obsoletus]|nr:MAG: hypothetical protein M1823_005735 [Watsoniomyces obsoletus]
MVPAFLVRHPPPSGPFLADTYFPYGPPIAPPVEVRPPSELSKDFFRNLRDLQNSMDDFSRVYDHLALSVGPVTSFADEELSSAVFVLLVALVGVLMVMSRFLPWRLISLVAGWTVISLGHPTVQQLLLTTHKEHVEPREPKARAWITEKVEHEFSTHLALESREVEIFELQRKSPTGEWEAWIFSPSPYDPLEAERICGRRPMGTRFLEDVQAPSGWTWTSSQWCLDLHSREWVEERYISAVEVETEGERWVYDLPLLGHHSIESGEMAFSDDGPGDDDSEQWRRRRWTRLVQQQRIKK